MIVFSIPVVLFVNITSECDKYVCLPQQLFDLKGEVFGHKKNKMVSALFFDIRLKSIPTSCTPTPAQTLSPEAKISVNDL